MRRLIVSLLLTWLVAAPACNPRPPSSGVSPPAEQTGASPTSAPPSVSAGPQLELTLTLLSSPAMPSPTPDPYAGARRSMVENQMRTRDITDTRVLAALEHVPRHEFVPPDVLGQAYDDHPLPIGYGQTISQPYIVALMTQLLDLQPGDKVLEIGTGSGYQAAVLAELTDRVYTIEIIPELAHSARVTLDRLGYTTIVSKQGDGYWGWEEVAPFKAIIVTAAPDHVPQPLLNQLADGGHMVIPVGPPGGYQSLWVITRQGKEFRTYNWGGVMFVPLTRSQ